MEPMTMKTLVAGLMAFGLVVAASRAGAAPLTLKECIAEAVERSPEMEAVRDDILAARQDVVKKQGTMLPYLSGQLDAYELNGSPVTPFSALHVFQPENPVLARQAHWGPVGYEGIGVAYPLYRQGSILGINNPPAVASAKAVVSEQEWMARISEQKLLLDVISAYWYAVGYRQEFQIYQRMVELAGKKLQIVQAQVVLELKLPQEIEAAKVELAANQQSAASAREVADDATLQLAVLMGRHADTRLDLDSSPPQLPSLPPVRRFLDFVIPDHPALQVQQARIEVVRQQLAVDKSMRLPEATLNTSFAVAQNLDYFNGNTRHPRPTLFTSFIQVDVPIFDFGQRRAAINESENKLLSEKARGSELEVELRNAIAQEYTQINGTDQALARLQSDYTIASNRAELAQAQRAEGLIDELSLVDANLALLGARVAIESEQVVKRLNYAGLQNLSGGTWQLLQ